MCSAFHCLEVATEVDDVVERTGVEGVPAVLHVGERYSGVGVGNPCRILRIGQYE